MDQPVDGGRSPPAVPRSDAFGIGGRAMTGGAAVFLDRDGVLNRPRVIKGRPHPPASLAEFELLPGVPEACRDLHEAGYLLIVVTNQPDIARGTLTPALI